MRPDPPGGAPIGRMLGCGVRVEPLPAHVDARGSVSEPLRPAELPLQRNVHVVLSAPGSIRGNHFHRRGTEICVVYGPALMRLRADSVEEEVEVPAGEAHRFLIPPGISHAIRSDGESPGLTVAFNTREHDPADPDTFRDVILEG